MDKRYQFTIDGKTYFKNVAPENEEKFFELYGEYNPTLESDELGKSQGTSQSQNNQQENTGFNLEDGSLESRIANDEASEEEISNYIDNYAKTYLNDDGTDKEPELGAWENFQNNLSNSLEMAGDVKEFWFLEGFGDKSYEEVAEEGNLGARSGLSIASTMIWEGVFGREKLKEYKEKNPNFLEAGTSDSEIFKKTIENFEQEREDRKETMTFKQADSVGDYMSVISGAIANVGGSVVYNLGTLGTGFFMDFASDNFIEANKIKAESKGKTLDQLLKDDEADIASPLKIAAVQTGLELFAVNKLLKPLGKGGTKVLGKKLTKKIPNSKSTRVGLDVLSSGSTEAVTEMSQYGLEYYNKKLAEAKAKDKYFNHAATIADGMFSEEGVESALQGFFGGGGLRGGAYSAKAIGQIRKNVSEVDVEKDLNNLVKLRKRYNDTKDEDVKAGLEASISTLEDNIKSKIKNGNEIYQSLSKEGISEIENLGDLADMTAYRISQLNKKFKNNKISKQEHTAALEGLTNKFNEHRSKILSTITTKKVKGIIEEADLDGKVTEMTSEEISKLDEEGLDSKSAATSFGFIKQQLDGGFEIILNKDKPMEGTAAHEFMHAVLFKTLGANSELQTNLGDALEQHVTTLGGDLTNVGRRLAQYGKWQKDKDGNITGFEKDANFGEETITIMSESILDGSLKFNEGFFTKIGDVVRRFSQNYLGKEIKFNTGRDVYNFIKDYNNSIKTGKVNKAIIQVAKEGAKGKLVEKKTETVAKETVTQQSKDAKPSVDNLGSKTRWNNNTWKKEGADKAIQEIKNKGLIDGLIAAKYKVRPVPANFVDDVLNSTFFVNHVRSFNPEVNDSLFGWINSQIRNKAGSVFNQNEKGKIPKEVKTVEADARTIEGQPVIQVEDVSANMETLTDNINYFETEVQPESTESKAEQSKLRREIGIGNLGKGEIFKKVRTALATSKAADEKGFIKDYEKNLASLLEPTIARILNDPAKLKKFRRGILEAIPIKTLVQMQKFLPEKIFVKDHGRQTNLTNLSKFVEKGLLPADILNNTPESKKRRAAGVRVYERLDTTTKQFENYIDAPVVDTKTGKRSGTRGNNRAKVISEVSKAIGRDATPEALTPEFVEDYLNIKDLKGKITPEKVIEKISEQIDRKPTLQFSKDQKEGFYMGVKNLANHWSKKTDVSTSMLESFTKYSDDKATYNGVFDPKTGESIMEAKTRFTIEFLEENPQFINYLMQSGLGSVSRSTYGSKEFFMNIVETALSPIKNEIKLNRYNYLKNKKQQPGKIDLNKKEQVVEDKKLDNLKDYFIAIQNFIQTRPRAAALFISFYEDGGAAGMGSTVRVSFPYKIRTIDQKTRKPNYKADMREEHNHPANQIHSALLYAAMEGNVEEAFVGIRASVMQGAITLDADNLVNKGEKNIYGQKLNLTSAAPDVWFDNVLPRVLSGDLKLEDGMGAVVRLAIQGVNLNELEIVGTKKTLAEHFNVGVDIKKMSDAQIERLIPVQNDLIIKQLKGEITKQEAKEEISAASKVKYSKSFSDVKKINNTKKAQDNIYKFSKDDKARGMSTFDFDETVGVSENFVIAKKGKDIKRIASNEWPFVGEDLAAQGYDFDFSDFNKVTKGKPGPLFEKMKNQIKKYGPENVFILTARNPQSEQAIHDWLKSNGINIPRKNVTGLGNSTGQAKADWMLEKFAEGYNDMYFVDDALPNVKAVKDVLEQLDIKSKVVQAKIKFIKDGPLDFNKILEQSKGVYAGKKFSAQEARKIGVGKGRLKFFVPPSAEDFKGLTYSFLGRGREGDVHAAWFKENLFDPFAKGIREWNTYKQAMSDDYQAVKKQFKTVGKKLNKKVPGTVFTNDNAIRVYLWDKAGFEIPGITESQIEKLVNHVDKNSDLKNFADALGVISRVPEGYVKPEGYWAVQSIASDLSNTVLKAGRKDFLAEWIENKNIVFSEENLNKIEAIYGTDFRDALENMLHRMETGTNRPGGKSKQVNMWLDWINGSVAATMFINIRSAALQTISTVNFVNMSDNNMFKAAAAFANQPQYWKDFSYIFNSPMLKQRRAGLQIDVSASEITKAFNEGKSKPEAILAYLLEKGFLPTQIADSFAISMGGAGFYRNRIKTYLKKGMSEAEAKKQAWLDFQEVAEETQQSSRPDLISMQQAGPMGRLILAWQNTPMQMTRLTKKALSDLVKRRKTPGYNQIQSDMGNISSIIYYGVAQNLIFGALQTGLMFLLFGWDEDEERKKKLELRTLNGALDTLLRGTGIYGAAVSTLKNVLLKWKEEREGPAWKRDDWNIAQEAINLSPPIGSKMRKLIGAIRTEKYNKGVSKEIGFRIENPNLSIAANWTEALTNIPVARVVSKANNVEEALNSNNDIWQRVALVSGWSRWSVGVEDEELKAAKEVVKEKRAEEKKKQTKKKKEEKKKEEQKKAPKKYRCRKRKDDGNRCKNSTTHKSQYCYAHR